LASSLDGIIATNTTTARPGLRSALAQEAGGLSGAPLRALALQSVAALHRLSGGRLPLIGVGGVFSAADAYALIRAGASLVQVYTGLVYRGPGLVGELVRGLAALLERDGFASIAQAVGSAQR
jgi:dihydroorotate dehydrogenase